MGLTEEFDALEDTTGAYHRENQQDGYYTQMIQEQKQWNNSAHGRGNQEQWWSPQQPGA